MPVVSLSNDHYKHKTYGKIYTPVFELHNYVSMEGEVKAPAKAELEDAPPETVLTPKTRERLKPHHAVDAAARQRSSTDCRSLPKG